MHPKFSICTLIHTETLVEALLQALREHCTSLAQFTSESKFLDFVEREKHQIDCLVLEDSPELDRLLTRLWQRSILLPIVVLDLMPSIENAETAVAAAIASMDIPTSKTLYHNAMLRLDLSQLGRLEQCIEQAIGKFLKLPPITEQTELDRASESRLSDLPAPSSLTAQQRRLADRLKERLGYLGVYYKRNPRNFLRYMDHNERQEFLQQLREGYREIVLLYFAQEETNLNETIDNFVNIAFFADVSVSQIVEIHMALMDEFSKQLKLEGRSEEILLDYRLTLIDVLAHLCEMYRRSIPRES